MHPLVSVVIPVYNGNNYLRDAINSALNQTYDNLEILVVDDGSTDDTWDIIQSYGNIIHGFHKENGGVSSALNLAIEHMNGEWFAWLSHDDLWSSDKIEKQIEYLKEHPDLHMCYTGYSTIDEFGHIITGTNGVWYQKGSDVRHMLYSNYINGITILVHRDCFDTVGKFDESLRYVQDYDMWIRIMLNYQVGLLPLRLAQSRIHLNQTGVKKKNDAVVELRNLKLSLLESLGRTSLFPELSSSSSSFFRSNVLKLRASLSLFNAKIHILANVPPLKKLVISTAGKILPQRIKRLIHDSFNI